MDKRTGQSETATGLTKKLHTERLHGHHKLYVGVDIGSTSSDIVVLSESGNIIFNDYQRTKGRPIETAQSQLTKALSYFNVSDIILMSATGSAGRFFADLLHIPFKRTSN